VPAASQAQDHPKSPMPPIIRGQLPHAVERARKCGSYYA
jgi:hypothetical protein